MLKKPMVAEIHAMNISRKPTMTMVNIEPTKNSVPAVLNEPSPVFSASLLKVAFRWLAASRKNTNAVISPAKKAIKPTAKAAVKTKLPSNSSVAEAAPMTMLTMATAAAIIATP